MACCDVPNRTTCWHNYGGNLCGPASGIPIKYSDFRIQPKNTEYFVAVAQQARFCHFLLGNDDPCQHLHFGVNVPRQHPINIINDARIMMTDRPNDADSGTDVDDTPPTQVSKSALSAGDAVSASASVARPVASYCCSRWGRCAVQVTLLRLQQGIFSFLRS